MARTLYLTALLFALIACLCAHPVSSFSNAESTKASRLLAEEAKELQDIGPQAGFDTEDEFSESCSVNEHEGEGIHRSLKRRCIGKERKLSWPWGRSRSKDEVEGKTDRCRDTLNETLLMPLTPDTRSSNNLLAAEQQLHLTNLMLIDRIQDPAEKAAAREREYDRRREQEVVFRQIR